MICKFRSVQTFIKPHNVRKIVAAKASGDSNARSLVNVIEDDKKKTANVVMQRPPVNSLNLELLEQLTSTIKDLEKKQFRGMILSSSSPTVFSAGLDITEMYKPNEERLRKFWTALQTMWKTLYLTPMVTIAAINGHAPAGGCLVSLSCDHSIMVKSRAAIGLNETMLGIVAPQWFRKVYINSIGFRQAEHALKLGKMFTPEEALKLGMVNEIVDSPSDVVPKAQEELDKWMKIPAAALQMTKLSMRKPDVDELISYEKKELEEIVHFTNQEIVQTMLGKYFDSLKNKKK
ncbi:Enoyl-CoA delta isomerase 1, mitochondrial [Araneus ventricosus]|uniref:Enoyl-CoA delta isomerase 1, mitochondrial n=1 Tax=Araneus ventricosus TaxID=182803 RepID=A0A4Y2PZR4_ARAVE|nr:Enoyl-CoA delta isomerase 1, mitochondrial [Araneus ventricosus]GBN55757.1 Enoyl-CoA delta isomerase 1, mitochondrial [Araneus ventricosus]GBN57099.1 Enoyl-CoA delta isomerase 1, mitochondrial [Araneus ventricosus]GBN69997.1 Enoyl-CoA delta isomerase 1, mitochondrial [Araneus ventricosus]